jgi:subtilisin-like proprotein convertase family protein
VGDVALGAGLATATVIDALVPPPGAEKGADDRDCHEGVERPDDGEPWGDGRRGDERPRSDRERGVDEGAAERVSARDGRRDLEDNMNQGDGSDLFGPVNGVALSSTSRPHTREWDGRESGFVLSNTLGTGANITLSSGNSLGSQTVTGERTPNLAIPDNVAGGVSSTIAIATSGIVRRIKTSIDIKHPYIGDLRVELFSPTGRRAVLHDRLGGSKDNISVSFDSNRPGELSNMVGLPMQGDWVLRVADRAAADLGTLLKWRIELESTSI